VQNTLRFVWAEHTALCVGRTHCALCGQNTLRFAWVKICSCRSNIR